MPLSSAKLGVAIFVVVAILGIGVFVSTRTPKVEPVSVVETPKDVGPKHEVIGNSVEGRAIAAYTYGTGTTHVLFVGGIHGGYEWNSVLLAYTFMDYLDAHPEIIPKNVSVQVIPSANPDGVYKVTGKEGRFVMSDVSTDKSVLASGRFNGNTVDLNRNFDCKWQPKSTWQNKTVSAGTAAFSEPEAKAVQTFIEANNPAAVVFWHSAAGAVYSSQCKNGILPETLIVMNRYASASGYPAIKTFDAYVTTGAADDWLASIGVPAVTVELKTHDGIEWEKNLAGVTALLLHYKE